MDWRRGRDPYQACAQAEDGPPGCATDLAVVARGSFSPDLGAELGEPGSAATAVAPSPHGAGAYPDHESTASSRAERRAALQEAVMAGTRTRAAGIVSPGTVGEPAPARPAGVAGSTEPKHHGAEPGDRAGSREVPRSPASDDASRCWSSHRTGLRTDHRRCEPLSVREAGGELSRTGTAGRLQRESSPTGPYH